MTNLETETKKLENDIRDILQKEWDDGYYINQERVYEVACELFLESELLSSTITEDNYDEWLNDEVLLKIGLAIC